MVGILGKDCTQVNEFTRERSIRDTQPKIHTVLVRSAGYSFLQNHWPSGASGRNFFFEIRKICPLNKMPSSAA